jgi:hypothetical protein
MPGAARTAPENFSFPRPVKEVEEHDEPYPNQPFVEAAAVEALHVERVKLPALKYLLEKTG